MLREHPPRAATLKAYVALIPAVPFLAALWLLGYQTFVWLKTGKWHEISAEPIARLLFPVWMDDNQHWVGFHRIIVGALSTPLWISVPVICYGGALIVSWLVGLHASDRASGQTSEEE